MADRKDWFFRQIVAEDELDEAFDGLENAERAIVSDFGIGTDDSNPDEFGGILTGLTPSLISTLDVQFTTGAAYDGQGRRVSTDATVTVTLSNEGSTDAGAISGVPDGTSINPPAGDELWAAVYIAYDRVLTDGRVDGNNQSVYFDRAESYHLEVAAGPTKATVGTPDVDGAPRQVDKPLLCDVKIQGSVGGPIATLVDTSRREVWFNVSGSPRSITETRLREVLKDILELYNNHVSDIADLHGASSLGYAGGDNWADGTPNPATNVELQLDKIITDLNATTGPSSGVKKLGAPAQAGTLQTPNSSSALSLSAGTLEAQLTQILDAVNGRVFRGGDSSIAGALLPDVTGKALGSTAQRWDINIRDLNISGSITGDLMPTVSGQAIGDAVDPWDSGYFQTSLNTNNLTVDGQGLFNGTISTSVADWISGIFPQNDNTWNIGSSSKRWAFLYADTVRVDTVRSRSGVSLEVLSDDDVNYNIPSGGYLRYSSSRVVDYWTVPYVQIGTSVSQWVAWCGLADGPYWQNSDAASGGTNQYLHMITTDFPDSFTMSSIVLDLLMNDTQADTRVRVYRWQSGSSLGSTIADTTFDSPTGRSNRTISVGSTTFSRTDTLVVEIFPGAGAVGGGSHVRTVWTRLGLNGTMTRLLRPQ